MRVCSVYKCVRASKAVRPCAPAGRAPRERFVSRTRGPGQPVCTRTRGPGQPQCTRHSMQANRVTARSPWASCRPAASSSRVSALDAGRNRHEGHIRPGGAIRTSYGCPSGVAGPGQRTRRTRAALQGLGGGCHAIFNGDEGQCSRQTNLMACVAMGLRAEMSRRTVTEVPMGICAHGPDHGVAREPFRYSHAEDTWSRAAAAQPRPDEREFPAIHAWHIWNPDG